MQVILYIEKVPCYISLMNDCTVDINVNDLVSLCLLFQVLEEDMTLTNTVIKLQS